MKQFDTLEIQKNVEEKRLILGRKLEQFLMQKVFLILNFFKKILAAKSCTFFGCLIIVVISILVRSARDIGHDSGVYLEIAQKILNGGKYYQDFFENNLPLSFLFAVIPVFLAKFFDASPIIFSEVFVNLVGISSLYLSARILLRSDVSKDRTAFNLIILSFAAGFFLRVFTLQFNEFATKSTYFLAFAFPYISYQFFKESQLKKSDQIYSGLLAAAIFCLKPHYGILVIVFELTKLCKNKSLKPSFCLRNYVTFVSLVCYLLLLLICFPDYLAAISHFSSVYYNPKYFRISLMLKEDLFPVFTLIFLCFSVVRKSYFLQPFFLATIAAGLIIISEVIGGYDQRFILYSFSLPLLALLVFTIIKNQQIDWKKDWFFIFLILLVPQFDRIFFTTTAFNFCAFWWIFAFILSARWRRVLVDNQFNSFLSKFFLQRSYVSWLCFLALAAFTISLSFYPSTSRFSWSISAIVFILMLGFYQNLHTKFFASARFSRLSACVIFTVLSYFISLHLAAIFSVHPYKSPNHINDQMIKTIKNYVANDEDATIISNGIMGTYPVTNYLKKENHLPSSQLLALYAKIDDHRTMLEAENHLFLRLKKQLKNPKNRLIFVETKYSALDTQNRIGFLEYYFYDQEFREDFLQNYVFLNRIIGVKPSKKPVEFFNDGHNLTSTGSSDLIENDVEVYVRKNDK